MWPLERYLSAFVTPGVTNPPHPRTPQARERPRSMMAAKSFRSTGDRAVLSRWMHILAEELAARLASDQEEWGRQPRNLVLSFRRERPTH